MRTFKKYGNRKIYSTQDHKYANLSQLYVELQQGANIVVVDHKTGEDVTLETIKHVILKCSNLGLQELISIIRNDISQV